MQVFGAKGLVSRGCYRVLRGLVWLLSPRYTLEGQEYLPQEPCLIIGNHSHMYSPIACELYLPGKRKIWTAAAMMHLADVAPYAFQDFWRNKPKWSHWFYKLLSHLIAPLSVCIFCNANTIGVYRDNRLLTTFRQTLSALDDGCRIVIFPECPAPYNHILTQFQDKYIDVARLYHKRTGKALAFVPMYVAPKLGKMCFGTPTQFRPDAPIEQERQRINRYLIEQITQIACALPQHTVIPYNNVPKRTYPKNITLKEVPVHEKAGR